MESEEQRRRKEGREESEEDMSTVSSWEVVSPGGVCQMMHTSHLCD